MIVTDQSGLTAVESADLALMRKIFTNRFITDPATGNLTVYDDDDVSVAIEFEIYEDAAGLQAYRSRGLERRNQGVSP